MVNFVKALMFRAPLAAVVLAAGVTFYSAATFATPGDPGVELYNEAFRYAYSMSMSQSEASAFAEKVADLGAVQGREYLTLYKASYLYGYSTLGLSQVDVRTFADGVASRGKLKGEAYLATYQEAYASAYSRLPREEARAVADRRANASVAALGPVPVVTKDEVVTLLGKVELSVEDAGERIHGLKRDVHGDRLKPNEVNAEAKRILDQLQAQIAELERIKIKAE